MSSGQRTGRLSTEGFPHRFLREAIELDIDAVDLSGSNGPIDGQTTAIVPGDRRISVERAPSWQRVRLSVSVNISDDVYNSLPTHERGSHAPEGVDAGEPPTQFLLAIRSMATIFRTKRTREQLELSDGDSDFEFELRSQMLAGDVTIEPFVVRTEPGEHGRDTPYANDVGDRLASGEEWTLRVDEPEEQDGSFLDPQIESFDRPGFPSSEHLHFLRFETPSEPQLYLNAEHTRLIKVMNSRGTTGGDPRLRDLLFDYIEQSVWQELLFVTASDADPETGEVDHPWQEELIALFADDLFGEDDEPEDVVVQMARRAQTQDDLDSLVAEFDEAIQRRIDHPTGAVSLLQEALSND